MAKVRAHHEAGEGTSKGAPHGARPGTSQAQPGKILISPPCALLKPGSLAIEGLPLRILAVGQGRTEVRGPDTVSGNRRKVASRLLKHHRGKEGGSVLELMHSMHETLGLIPSAEREEEKRKERKEERRKKERGKRKGAGREGKQQRKMKKQRKEMKEMSQLSR